MSIKKGSISWVQILLIKLHFSTLPAVTWLWTYLDLEPGVLRAETDVAGCDQVDACRRDDAPSQHHKAFSLGSCGAKSRPLQIMTHLPQCRHRGWPPPQAWDTGRETWWEISENNRESTRTSLSSRTSVWHFYMLIYQSIVFPIYLIVGGLLCGFVCACQQFPWFLLNVFNLAFLIDCT